MVYTVLHASIREAALSQRITQFLELGGVIVNQLNMRLFESTSLMDVILIDIHIVTNMTTDAETYNKSQ